jgi:hypothetical protein
VDRVTEYLKTHDLTPDLCRARHLQSNLREETSASQASMRSLRQGLHMLLWMDEWEPLDPARCWSECIRRDFRDDRRAPRALARFAETPSRQRAGAHACGLGETGRTVAGCRWAGGLSRDSITLWFAPFRSR